MVARWWARAPGLMAVVAIAAGAQVLAVYEQRLLGRVLLDPLVLAILLGILVRAILGARESLEPGVQFAAKDLLEVAVALLGATVSVEALRAAGPALGLGIIAVVVMAVPLGIAVGRALGLPLPLATLIAAGNAICGNSAIAAVAPAIGARREDAASAVAFTALLGMVAVLALPWLLTPLGLSHREFGVLAGATVYAVPQVLAAAFPVSDAAGEMATLVKLTRVLMLGPVVLAIAAWWHRRQPAVSAAAPSRRGWVPWFIVAFAALAVARALGLLPITLAETSGEAAHRLTLAAMAGLGLGVDLGEVRRVGARAAAAATLGLLGVMALSLGLIALLRGT